jgi:endonuclease/exonuclease/phosphatase (EEP) superfamily protein YafD
MQVAEPGAGCCRRSSRSSPWRSPEITIDHALARNAVASSIMATELTGSNHRSLLANISVPIVAV